MNITQKSITSSAYSSGANLIQVGILFLRSIVLTRYLTPGIFGEFILISTIISLTQTLPDFGLQGAFIYTTSKDNEREALKTHFSLNILLSLLWLLCVFIGSYIFVPLSKVWIYWLLAILAMFSRATITPRVYLMKEINFRRLSIIQVISTIIASFAAISLAMLNYGIWCLIFPRIFTVIVQILGFYLIQPVWKPQFGWNKHIVRQFLRFGRKTFLGKLLLQALDQVDDLWTGLVLGETPLGFYNRAYKFANYPRRILSAPLVAVSSTTYAQVKDDRQRLSKAFFRVNALLVRVNFLFAGLLALVAPEFIRLVIGSQWLPMLDAFRLMIVYTLLDPIKGTIANVINASGKPEKVIRARLVQLVIMILGLYLLVPKFKISGVAVSVNIMLLVGIGILFWQVREFVDFSLLKLFGVPGISLVIGMIIARILIEIPGVLGSDWRTASIKIGTFSLVYLATLFITEKENMIMIKDILNQFIQSLPIKSIFLKR